MTEALLRRASEVVASSSETISDPAKTACLFICGHGTSLNDNSTKIIHEQAAIIRARGLYADCQAVLMEQTPFVKNWRTLTDCPDVIVVPFFIADGLHSFEDIPVLLGLTHNMKEKGFANPHRRKRSPTLVRHGHRDRGVYCGRDSSLRRSNFRRSMEARLPLVILMVIILRTNSRLFIRMTPG